MGLSEQTREKIRLKVAMLLNRRRAYRSCFYNDNTNKLSLEGQVILKDLAKFCYSFKSTVKVSPKAGTIDPLAMAIAEGRRETYLRILGFLKIDEKVLINLQTNQEELEND